jgi:hypothetical protein
VLSRDELVDRYERRRHTCVEIAADVGVTSQTVSRWLSHHGIASRPRGGNGDRWTVEEQALRTAAYCAGYRAGLSVHRVAGLHGVHTRTVSRRLHESGVVLRGTNDHATRGRWRVRTRSPSVRDGEAVEHYPPGELYAADAVQRALDHHVALAALAGAPDEQITIRLVPRRLVTVPQDPADDTPNDARSRRWIRLT